MPPETPADYTTLAREALDLWQSYLADLAADPKAKENLAVVMEPSRRMFAEWLAKAQTAPHGTGANPFQFPAGFVAPGSAPAAAAPDAGAQRLHELTLRVAELEKRIAELESRKRRAPAKAARAPRKPE